MAAPSDVQLEFAGNLSPRTSKLLEKHHERHKQTKPHEKQSAWHMHSDTHGGEIFCRCWAPKTGSPSAVLFLVHGVNEHVSRYVELAHHMTAQGWAVIGHDHWGHGASGGFQGDIESFEWVVKDLKQVIRAARADFPTQPFFIFGHSMGSIVGFHAAFELEREEPGLIKAAVFSGCAMVPGPSAASPFGIKCLFCLTKSETAASLIGGFLARNQPRGPLAPVFVKELTHHQAEVEFIASDPHHNRGPLLNRTGDQIFRAVQRMKQLLGQFTLPFLALHGDADTVTLPISSQLLFDTAGSTDKSLKFYKGLYHELLKERPEDRARVLADVSAFLTERAKAAAAGPTIGGAT